MAKKLNREDFQFKDRQSQELVKVQGDINGIQFMLYKLNSCQVQLLDHCGPVTADHCNNCTLQIGPVQGSIFLRNCENTTVSVACEQFRARDLKNCKVFLHCISEPVIETSSELTFAPYNLAYPGQKEHFEAAKLDINLNKWNQIHNFSPEEGVDHWTRLSPAQFQIISRKGNSEEEPQMIIPYSTEYGGTVDEEMKANSQNAMDGGGMMAFDFGVTPEQAMKAYQEAEQNQEPENAKQIEADDVNQGTEAIFGDQSVPHQTDEHRAQEYQPPDMGMFAAEQHQDQPFPADASFPLDQAFPTGGDFQAGGNMGFQQDDGYQPPLQDTNFDQAFGEAAPMPQEGQGSFWDQAGVAPSGGVWQEGGLATDIDPEEQALFAEIERQNQERNKKLYEKDLEEQKIIQERRNNAREELRKWHDNRFTQIQKKKEQNQTAEAAFYEYLNSQNQTSSPWEKVVGNIELKAGNRIGSKDVTRMKQAILNKKNDTHHL